MAADVNILVKMQELEGRIMRLELSDYVTTPVHVAEYRTLLTQIEGVQNTIDAQLTPVDKKVSTVERILGWICGLVIVELMAVVAFFLAGGTIGG